MKPITLAGLVLIGERERTFPLPPVLGIVAVAGGLA